MRYVVVLSKNTSVTEQGMKTICKSPHTGQTSSKRVLALAFGAAAILLAFIMAFFKAVPDGMVTIITTFAVISGGNQALATSKMETQNVDNNRTKDRFGA